MTCGGHIASFLLLALFMSVTTAVLTPSYVRNNELICPCNPPLWPRANPINFAFYIICFSSSAYFLYRAFNNSENRQDRATTQNRPPLPTGLDHM
jgi:hypothetical protein